MRQVSDLLGIPAPTLRSWELRYQVPDVSRSAGGHRRYALEELQQLRLMRDEIARGLRAADAARSVKTLLDEGNPSIDWIDRFLVASERGDASVLSDVLEEAREQLGFGTTIDQVVLPAMRQVGAWWESGQCGVAQEHTTTETVRRWFARITTLSDISTGEPPILLACGPQDQHSLGLEALAALLAQQHRGSRLMGPRPSQQLLVDAVQATGAKAVVVVSHLSTQRRPAVDALAALVQTGAEVFYAGNAFSSAAQRVGVPGTYLGESLAVAVTTIDRRLQASAGRSDSFGA